MARNPLDQLDRFIGEIRGGGSERTVNPDAGFQSFEKPMVSKRNEPVLLLGPATRLNIHGSIHGRTTGEKARKFLKAAQNIAGVMAYSGEGVVRGVNRVLGVKNKERQVGFPRLFDDLRQYVTTPVTLERIGGTQSLAMSGDYGDDSESSDQLTDQSLLRFFEAIADSQEVNKITVTIPFRNQYGVQFPTYSGNPDAQQCFLQWNPQNEEIMLAVGHPYNDTYARIDGFSFSSTDANSYTFQDIIIKMLKNFDTKITQRNGVAISEERNEDPFYQLYANQGQLAKAIKLIITIVCQVEKLNEKNERDVGTTTVFERFQRMWLKDEIVRVAYHNPDLFVDTLSTLFVLDQNQINALRETLGPADEDKSAEQIEKDRQSTNHTKWIELRKVVKKMSGAGQYRVSDAFVTLFNGLMQSFPELTALNTNKVNPISMIDQYPEFLYFMLMQMEKSNKAIHRLFLRAVRGVGQIAEARQNAVDSMVSAAVSMTAAEQTYWNGVLSAAQDPANVDMLRNSGRDRGDQIIANMPTTLPERAGGNFFPSGAGHAILGRQSQPQLQSGEGGITGDMLRSQIRERISVRKPKEDDSSFIIHPPIFADDEGQ